MNEINFKKLLFTIADVLEDIGVEFFLDSGTLLGAIREKKFIESDRVVNLAMLQENLIPVAKDIENQLVKKGLGVTVIDHRHKRPWDNSVYSFKICSYGARCELSSYRRIKGKRAIPSHLNDYWATVTARLFEELDEIEFYGRTFKKPKDADGYLTEWYGNWRTPMKLSDCTSSRVRPESWIL